MSRRSLTLRLVSWYGGLLLMMGAIFATCTYASLALYTQKVVEGMLASRTDEIAALVSKYLNRPDYIAVVLEDRFLPEAHDRYIRVTAADGTVLYTSGEPAEHGFDPNAVPQLEVKREGSLFGRLNYDKLWIYARRLPANEGGFLIETGHPDNAMLHAERGLTLSLMFGLPSLLVIAAVGGYALIQRAFAPVAAMIEAAEALTFNSPRKRLPLAKSGDRIDELGRALNRMLARLDRAYQHASRFSADAAHELRTPLAILRGELEFAIAQPGIPAEVQTSMAEALDEAARLAQIVESLLALARLDSVAGKLAHRPVDLRLLTAETLDQMRLLAEEKHITLALIPGEEVFALGDKDRLKQVVANLIDNAVKYTQEHGQVMAQISHNDGTAILSVSDTGIGIAPELQSMVFERFFRASLDRGSIGAGLGLAIVKSICQAHGGDVTVESQVGQGSIFRVELPLASAEYRSSLVDEATSESSAA